MSNSAVRILVVDDNPATRYSTSRVLRSAAWTVFEAETGTEGLEKAFAGIDLVILDVNLPDIDGFEVCRRLRANPATSRLPILHLSATFVSTSHKVTGLDAGADGYLIHPIEPPVLIATVNAFLRTRQAEIELRQSEARFKAIFENALTGVALLNDEMVCVDANPTMCLLLKLNREQLTGRSLRDFVSADQVRQFDEIKEQLAGQTAWHGVLPLVRTDGEIVSLEWHMSTQSETALRLAIVSDISDRMRYELERETLLQSERAARADAERANRIKDDFLATLSHELRTPLNAIVGWAQLLRTGKLQPADFKEGVEAIDRNARAQAQMIADLLDVSRITSGKIRLEMEPLDPAVVIEAALSAILPTAQAKSIRITRELDSSAGTISGDASRLQQVIWNLVNNAVKFTPRDGLVQVSLHRSDSQIKIRVADNGHGIRPDLLPTIFERFRQGDSSSTREYGGLGLGLAIARQLVEMHGGTISAESPGVGLGASFTVSLPILALRTDSQRFANAIVPLEPSDMTSVDLSGARVFLVEDDPDSRNMLVRILTSCGAEVGEASSVELALERLAHFEPDVLISDLGMPGRDGFDLIRELRQRGYTIQQLPAIALTAFARTEDRTRALLGGFQVHLAKPVDPHELTSAIASFLDRTD